MTLKKKNLLVSTNIPRMISLNIDGLVQERCNSSELEMELRLSCTNPLIYGTKEEQIKCTLNN